MEPDEFEKLLDAKFEVVNWRLDYQDSRLNTIISTLKWIATAFLTPVFVALAVVLLEKIL